MKRHTTRGACQSCGRPASLDTPQAVTCDPCEGARIRGLLGSEAWLAARGQSSGDLPGETLEDTLRRELAHLTV